MHSTQNLNDEAVSLAGVSASSLPARRVGQPVILIFSRAESRRPEGSG